MLVPARIPPHKPVQDEPGPRHRLELCRLAVAGDDERFEVSDLEVLRSGTSFTVDTLEELHARTPDSELHLIVGADIAAGLPEWYEPERVLSLAGLAVAERPGTERAAVERALGGLRGSERARFFDMPEIGLSSTMLRERVRAGRPIRYLTRDAVAAYVGRHNLYEGDPSDER